MPKILKIRLKRSAGLVRSKYSPRQARDQNGQWRNQTGANFDSKLKKWVGPDGKPLSARDQKRIKSLGIGPGYSNVRLNKDLKAPLQAYVHDVKGRNQRKYKTEFSKGNAADKFARVRKFNPVRKKLEAVAYKKALAGDDDAAALFIIDRSAIRIGSRRETLADVQAYGATTLKVKHVKVKGGKVTFDFTGKKGVQIKKTQRDAKLARVIRERQQGKGPDDDLLKTSDDRVRKFMGRNGGKGFLPKDYRTWHATAQASALVRQYNPPHDKAQGKAIQKEVCQLVSNFLGNTPAVCKASYIDPAVWQVMGENAPKSAKMLPDVKVLGFMTLLEMEMERFLEEVSYDEPGRWDHPRAAFDPDDDEDLVPKDERDEDFLQLQRVSKMAQSQPRDSWGRWTTGGGGIPVLAKLTFDKPLGGSTGAALYKDADGNSFVVKRGKTPAHIMNEVSANKIYKAAGIPVPAFTLDKSDPKRPAMITKYVEGKPLGKLSGDEKVEAIASIKKGFAADALLANWDVVGATQDNIVVPVNGKGAPQRVDNGGSMVYRAQGGTKPFKSPVGELESMRTSSQGKPVFGDLSDKEVAKQIKQLSKRREAIMKATPMSLRPDMADRLDYMDKWAKEKANSKPPKDPAKAGRDAHGRFVQGKNFPLFNDGPMPSPNYNGLTDLTVKNYSGKSLQKFQALKELAKAESLIETATQDYYSHAVSKATLKRYPTVEAAREELGAIKAMRSYKGSSAAMNSNLRKKNALTSHQKRDIGHLDDLMAPIDSDFVVYRGQREKPEHLAKILKAKGVTDLGYASTSSSRGTAENFAGNTSVGDARVSVLYVVRGQKGHKLLPIDGLGKALGAKLPLASEREVLLQRGTRMNIKGYGVKKTYGGKETHILELEIVRQRQRKIDKYATGMGQKFFTDEDEDGWPLEIEEGNETPLPLSADLQADLEIPWVDDYADEDIFFDSLIQANSPQDDLDPEVVE